MATADAYTHCATLTRDQWAWEFLRHNPEYRADYRQFIALWQALEADYGAPPNRDFQRWKQDPRAYGPLPDNQADALAAATGDLCIGENDRVFLECWMGAKWGFHKFPLDPAQNTPPSPDQLSWRPPPAAAPRPADSAYRLDIAFDFSLPLPPQLEAAKFRLVSRAAELRRAGHAVPLSVASQHAAWTRLLHVLDARAAGASVADLCESGLCEDEAHCARLLAEAHSLTQAGYLDILRVAG